MIELPEQFRKWRELHGFTQGEAAERLGVSRRSVVVYESTGPIPKYVALACEALTDETQAAGYFERLVKEQHPRLGEHILVMPFLVRRTSTYEELIEIGFMPEVKDWVQDNTPSARFSLQTIITPEMRRLEIAVVSFENAKEAVYFKLRWC
jgi:transcriptional regulator with XRE-family HTH domain